MAKNKVVAEPVAQTPAVSPSVGDANSAQIVERLTAEDLNSLNTIKLKQELALSQAKTAVAGVELAKSQYDLFIMKLANSYSLKDGDQVSETGEITRL